MLPAAMTKRILSISVILILIAITGASAGAAVPRFAHLNTRLCEFVLTTPMMELGDLINSGLVEPEGKYLHTLPEAPRDHEHNTAKLLAERLKRPLVLLPRLSRVVNVPAVDGVLYDANGVPQSNFSLKKFFPSQNTDLDLNDKLLNVMNNARKSVEINYSLPRWREIIGRTLPPTLGAAKCDLECQLYSSIFGVTAHGVRPVSVVIDYTEDPTAVFRLHMKLDEKRIPEVYVTLNSHDRGINVLHLMERIRAHSTVKEYIFLGAHHMLIVNADSYQMSEFCDGLGHAH